ncbi:MAG: flagellar protein FlgN [Desulfuromonadaceae bacterium]|nr:flagellar protein FlgN [Desulfuromonadaceae bacterium]
MELKKMIEELTVQTGLLNELLQVLERETAEMGDVNINAMTLSNKAKEELTARITKQTPCLQQAISAQAVREGLPGSASLGTVAVHIAKRGNRDPLARQQQIRMTAERIQQVASLNHEIAERFSASVTTSLNLISRLINQSNVYGASGGYHPRPAGAVMINREA